MDRWRTLVDTNLNGPFLMARAATPFFVEQKWGRIVNIGTGYEGMLRDHFSPYGPVKAALEAATLVWSKDLEGGGVTVNVLMPGGAADTPQLSTNVFPDRSVLLPASVMGAPIAWLASRKSDGVTGYRFIAMHWDPAADDDENLERAVRLPDGNRSYDGRLTRLTDFLIELAILLQKHYIPSNDAAILDERKDRRCCAFDEHRIVTKIEAIGDLPEPAFEERPIGTIVRIENRIAGRDGLGGV